MAAVAVGVAEVLERAGLGRRRPRREALLESARAASSSALSRNSVERLSSGGFTSKNGFSVVAPISVTRPLSTPGSSASCCDLLKRWTSSRNRIVPWPSLAEAVAGPLEDVPHVLHAGADGAELLEGLARGAAMACARVVLPVPGGPQRITDDRRSASTSVRSGCPAPARLLPDDVVEGPRPQPRRPGRVAASAAPPPPRTGRHPSADDPTQARCVT